MLEDLNNYHQQTKHSYLSIRTNPNRVDWDNPPNRFKNYPNNFERIKLDTQNKEHLFLYLICGITAKKSYPGIEYYLRVNPSAGALYPNEVYFQVRNNKSFEDGIYHLEVSTSSIVLLKSISENEGIEKDLGLNASIDGFIFFISSIYFRSSWKYKKRALRYCLLDAGHILGTLEASSYLFEKEFEVLYDFSKELLNSFFSFDNKEFITSVCIVGKKSNDLKNSFILDIPTIDGSSYEDGQISFFEKNELIENAYLQSLKIKNKKVQTENTTYNFEKNHFQEVIFKRRSIREFTNKSISKLQFKMVMDFLNQPIKSDCDEDIDIYYVINRVEESPLGIYKNQVLLKEGDFSSKAGYLCLEQDLGKDSAVTFFLCSKSKNYQEAYQKAGILGHRLYLISNYLDIGCSGIGAYYDDEVCEFFKDNTMVLYALAIGN